MNASLLQAHILAQGDGDTVQNPVSLVLDVELSGTNWETINTAIAGANKYVSLDLSDCTPSTAASGSGLTTDGIFNGDITTNNQGISKIVELIIASDIVQEIGAYSFSEGVHGAYKARNLITLNLPHVKIIGSNAFENCYSLESIILDEATDIGDNAFYHCYGLTGTLSLPSAENIGRLAFAYCRRAIEGTGITSVELPAALTIGDYAFVSCESLSNVYMPLVTSIGTRAFQLCFPSWRSNVITLGAAPPSVGTEIFDGSPNSTGQRTINVHIPTASNSVYDQAWKTSFHNGATQATFNYVLD
jgi:hypothetical protein